MTMPAALAPFVALPQWVGWRFETNRQGHPTKVPYQLSNPARRASTKDPNTWSACPDSLTVANFDGVGFVLKGTTFAVFDIDDCRDPASAELHPWAQAKLERCASYAEVTPSGTGIRIIGNGSGPEVHRKLTVADGVTCEIYRSATRYITVTGAQINGSAFANLDLVVEETLAELGRTEPPRTRHTDQQTAALDEDELDRTIQDGGETRHGPTRSDAVFWVVNEMLRRGYAEAPIGKVLLDRANGIADHIYDQADPERCVARTIANAKAHITLAVDDKGKPYPTDNNIRIAMLRWGITLRYDSFADRVLLAGLKEFGPFLDDAAVLRIVLTLPARYKLKVQKGMVRDVLQDMARLNGFHPVRDYLDALHWDDVPRIDKWLTTYAGAANNAYTRAVGALTLIAGVRRIRRPGCKFDEMPVLESPQGNNKSSALAIMAVKEEWFSDSLPLNADDKRVIEATRGRWIIEIAELSGMRRADVEHLKAFLSRQTDRGRMAYAYLPIDVPREWIPVGTTNAEEYLRDTTGNRRLWPVKVNKFDLAALARDRDQLWAEAAQREATGASIRLNQSLWKQAAEEQDQRATPDPFVDELTHALGDVQGKIAAIDIWKILNIAPGHRTQDMNRRLGEAIRKCGWQRPNKAGQVKISGKMVSGYAKGPQPWATVAVTRTENDMTITHTPAASTGDDDPETL